MQKYAKREWDQDVTIHNIQDTFNKLGDYKVVNSWSYSIPGRMGRHAVNVMRRKTGRESAKGAECETVTLRPAGSDAAYVDATAL